MSFSWRRTFRKTDGNREYLRRWDVISYWLVYPWYKKSWFYQESEINFPQLNRQLSTLQKVWKKELLRYFLINEWEHSKDNNVQGLKGEQFCFLLYIIFLKWSKKDIFMKSAPKKWRGCRTCGGEKKERWQKRKFLLMIYHQRWIQHGTIKCLYCLLCYS